MSFEKAMSEAKKSRHSGGGTPEIRLAEGLSASREEPDRERRWSGSDNRRYSGGGERRGDFGKQQYGRGGGWHNRDRRSFDSSDRPFPPRGTPRNSFGSDEGNRRHSGTYTPQFNNQMKMYVWLPLDNNKVATITLSLF